MAILIDGKTVAKAARDEVARKVKEFQARAGRVPGLHVVLAGEDPASALYVRNKEKAAAEVGMHGMVHRLPASVSERQVLDLVSQLNADDSVDGILVQLPLPDGILPAKVVELLDPAKDVDGLSPVNVGRLWSGGEALAPCTPRGVLRLLDSVGTELKGARALVVGRSNLVGKPVAALLLARHATVSLAHSRTRDLRSRCQEADVLVAAIGRSKMIGGDWIQPGATVIDVGTNRDENGKLCGDVDFAQAEPVARAITPVPGGVGPMTIAMLLDNTLRAAEARSTV
ncbi:bifunctional methylenetetrahydrofolate dehydrogenase/methenyltetrahydrofolate cyclohydrolase FolD [Myxococcota bacterium]